MGLYIYIYKRWFVGLMADESDVHQSRASQYLLRVVTVPKIQKERLGAVPIKFICLLG